MLTYYYSKASSALAAHILLEEIGVDYDAVEVSIAKGAHKTPEYLAINPKARVPALRDGAAIVTENPAILGYLAARFPEKGLLPTDPLGRARADEVMAYLCATGHIAFAHIRRGIRWSDDPDVIEGMKLKVPQNMREVAELVEAHYLAGPWVLGAQYSVCDPYLFLLPQWLKVAGVPLADFPKLNAHHDAMMARPATQRAMELHGVWNL